MAWLALGLSIHAVPPPANAFLDQPFPKEIELKKSTYPSPDGKKTLNSLMLPVPSYRQGIELLGEIAGKKIILPDGLADWLKMQSTNDPETSLGSFSISPTRRDSFELLCRLLGMVWQYDARQDAIVLGYHWKREGVRSGRELATILADVSIPKEKILQGSEYVSNDWHAAFDALLSRPENYERASILRLYHDSRENFGLGPYFINLFSGKIREGAGPDEILVLNGKHQVTNKGGPGSIAYYLFDREGRLLRGGVYSMGHYVGCVLRAGMEDDHTVTIDVGWGSFAFRPTHFHFGLVKGDLVLLGSTDANGKQRNADETRAEIPKGSYGVCKLEYIVPGGT